MFYNVLRPLNAQSAAQVEQLSNSALELISQITRKAEEEHAATLERNRATLEGLVEQDAPAELKRKVLATVTALKEGLLERETEVRTAAPAMSVVSFEGGCRSPCRSLLPIPLQVVPYPCKWFVSD